MKTKLLGEVERFFHHHLKSKNPLLLALSGGPDSISLFSLLLEKKIHFHVAHVNHRWRKESDEEADLLEKMCQKKKIPFYKRELCLSKEERDLENGARKLRLEFFKELCLLHGFEAVLLGHHADDLAETVLKRVLEGASLYRLNGFSEVSYIEGMALWRPLIRVQKKEILHWLNERKIPYFQDSTNLDPKFLRTRIRHSLLPFLSESFGKEVTPSLIRLSRAAEELEVFVNEIVNLYKPKITSDLRGFSIDFSKEKPATNFEWKAILRNFFNQKELTPSILALESLIFHLKKRRVKKSIKIGSKWVRIEDGHLILLEKRG